MTTPRGINTHYHNPALERSLDNIETHSKDAGLYLKILLEEMAPYADDPKYQTQPKLVDPCFGPDGLDDDINEIIHHLMHDIPPLARSECLISLLEATKENPVNYHYVKQICDNFDIKLPEDTEEDEGETVIRFYAPNLHFDRRESENFLRACGLEPITDEGSGSHTKWVDPQSGIFMSTTSRSKKVWLKNSIKDLLEKKFPPEKIQAACDKLKIDFKVLSG